MKAYILAALALSTSFLMGCGSATSAGDSSSVASSVSEASTKPLAYCNQTTDPAKSLTASLGAFLNSSGQADFNYLHIKLSNVPSTFTDNTHYFSVFKWYADSSGTAYTYNQPLTFKLVNIQTNQEISGDLTTMSWSTVKTLATAMGLTTPAQFFLKVRLLVYVNDPAGKYQAVTIGYHKASNGVVDNRIDALMPVFEADPRNYKVTHPMILQILHPFYSSSYSGWSTSTFTSKASDLCAPLTQYR